jgi:hypothetical protein
MLMNCEKVGKPTNGRSSVDMETPLDAGADLKAVRTGIGAELRTLHADLLREGGARQDSGVTKALEDTDSACVASAVAGCGERIGRFAAKGLVEELRQNRDFI